MTKIIPFINLRADQQTEEFSKLVLQSLEDHTNLYINQLNKKGSIDGSDKTT